MEVLSTFILFTIEDGEVTKIHGPVFEEEIEDDKKEYFEVWEEIEILDETSFKVLYQDQYEEDKRDNWLLYLGTQFDAYSSYLPDFHVNQEEECIESEFFCIFKDSSNDGMVNIQLSLSINPLVSGLICFLTQKYLSDVLDIEFLLSPFYFSILKSEVCIDSEAIYRYNQERGGAYVSAN